MHCRNGVSKFSLQQCVVRFNVAYFWFCECVILCVLFFSAGMYNPYADSNVFYSCSPFTSSFPGSLGCDNCYDSNKPFNPSCLKCSAGRYQNFDIWDNSVQCNLCSSGYVSLEGAGCSNCPPTTFAVPGQPTCLTCPPGHYSPYYGSSVCNPCNYGTFSNGSFPYCSSCSFSIASGATTCESDDNSINCKLGYFAVNSTCLKIPAGNLDLKGDNDVHVIVFILVMFCFRLFHNITSIHNSLCMSTW